MGDDNNQQPPKPIEVPVRESDSRTDFGERVIKVERPEPWPPPAPPQKND